MWVRSALFSAAIAVFAPMAAPGVAAGRAAPTPAPTSTATAARSGPKPGTTCALPDITPIPVPTPSPLPVHDASLPTLGGDGLAGNGLSVPDGAPTLPANLAATSWLVADLDTGEVLGSCGAHRYGAPASLQKLLLVETVLPKLKPTDVTTITTEDLDFEPGSSAVGLLLGAQWTVEQLFLGLLLNSGNDAANTLARLGSGGRGVPAALADMNAEARRLGAWDTHAETPSGLDGPGQATSAYDLALIFRACYANADFRRYVATRTAQMPPQPPRDLDGFQIQNDNRLLFEYPGALGGKTGFTDIARHTYVGAAERDGRRLVVSVLGAEIRPVRAWLQGAGLLDWGFSLPRGSQVGHLVAPGEADTLVAPKPEPTPEPTPVAALPVVPVTQPESNMLLAAVGAGAIAFAGAWLLAMRLGRRRRATRRHWRADRPAMAMATVDAGARRPDAPAVPVEPPGPPLVEEAPVSPAPAVAAEPVAVADHSGLSTVPMEDGLTTDIPVVRPEPPLMGQPPDEPSGP